MSNEYFGQIELLQKTLDLIILQTLRWERLATAMAGILSATPGEEQA